jgi:ATP-dependent DNA helicase PIF1
MNFTFSIKQTEFLNAVKNGQSVYLSGKAGTGKTYVVKSAIDYLRGIGKKVVAVAPTGIAANNIQGQTCHSFFALDPHGVLTYEDCKFVKSEKRRMYNKIDVLIIDEISMLRPDMLDAINWTLVKNGCKSLKDIQVIFVGDLKQLPPVVKDNFKSVLFQTYNGLEFYESFIYKKLKIKSIELDEVLRQSDVEFITNLNIIRDGGKAPFFKQFIREHPRGVILAPHNATVSAYNKLGLEQVDGDELIFRAVVDGNLNADDFNLESIIHVKDGAKIMYLVNSKDNNLINGTLGKFRIGRDDKYYIDVKGVSWPLEPVTHTKKEYILNEKEDTIELREVGSITQYPFRLAYALSIHKSQGLTFDEVTIDLTNPAFAPGQIYTALSRVTSPDGLTIIMKSK